MQAAFFSKLVNTSKDAIIVIDSQEVVVFWNAAATINFGYTEVEALGQNLHKLIIPERYQFAHTKSAFVNNHHRDNAHERMIEVMAVNKQGQEIPFEVSISSIVFEGQIYWAGFMRNITNKRQREHELKEAKHLAEIASAAKSEFLANMSHEIRTPMNVIIGLTDHILDSDEQEMTHKNICMINDAAKLLLNIINQILDFSKVEAGKLELNKVAFDVTNTIHSLIKIMENSAVEKDLQLVLYYDSTIPRVAVGDSVRLQQVLINLLGNAIKFTDRGKVELYVKLLEKTNDQRVRLSFSVIDSGIGIAANKMTLLFNSFSQVDNSLARPYEGTGLGLAISRKLVQLMGGDITVKSELGKGSEFEFEIELEVDDTVVDNVIPVESWRLSDDSRCRVCEHPANQVTANTEDNEQIAGHKQQEIGEEGCQNINILLVEDKPMNQVLARTILQKQGWQVTTADNGLLALEKIKQASYDVILMDIQMPELDGVETTKRIRAMQDNPNSRKPIIAMTANAMAGDREKYLEQGMDDYIGKPYVAAELKQLIIKHCNNNQQEMLAPLQAAYKMLQEDKELLVNIISAFVEDCKQDIQKLKQALHEQNAKEIAETAHGIKGELGNIRLTYWYDIAYKLEQDAKVGYSEDLADNTQKFIEELLKLLEYLEDDNWESQLGG